MFNKLLLAFWAFNLNSQLLAGTCCNTPTIWTFKNSSKSLVTLSCKLESSSAWISSKSVTLQTSSIPAGETYTHNWGADWYSDGMGMIPGSWSCQDARTGKEASTPRKQINFSTDWGENVTVEWKGDELRVARAQVPTTKDSKPASN